MTCLTRALAVIACLVPGVASAATVAAFSAEAGASLTLLSARVAGSRTDALEFLDVVFDMDDAAWSEDTTGTGTLSEDADLSQWWEGGLDLWVEGAGHAADPAGSAAADSVFDHAVELLNLGDCWPGACDVSVRLTFGYRLSAQATGAGGHAASASARAFLGIGKGFGSLDLFQLSADAAAEPLFGFDASDAQSRSGTFSVTLAPDESLFAYLYVEYEGEARVAAPAPAPLPASALLLAVGLGGLGAFRRRRVAAG